MREEETGPGPEEGTEPDDAVALWAKVVMTFAPFLLLALLVAALMRMD